MTFPHLPDVRQQKGFTIIELLVGVSIIALIGGAVISNYNRFNESQRVKQVAQTFKNDLRLAQSKASTGVKPSDAGCVQLDGYIVEFDQNGAQYYISPYCDSAKFAGGEQEYKMPNSVIFTSPGQSIIFYTLSRGTSLASDVEIRLQNSASTSHNYYLKVTPGGDIKDCGDENTGC